MGYGKIKGARVKHKDKKKCMVLMSVMQKQRDMPKGSLLEAVKPIVLCSLDAVPDEENVLHSHTLNMYRPDMVPIGTCVIYLDVVWDPKLRCHFFRFLTGSKILGLRYTKGETVSEICNTFKVVRKGTHDIDAEKKKWVRNPEEKVVQD